jgi:RNA polymerase sigma-70 factor (ECF subfamily)
MLNTGFFKILTNLNKYEEGIPFEAWASRIMINCLIDDYRKNKRNKEFIEYQDLNGHEYGNSQVDFNDADKAFEAEEIELMILKLPERTRTVFNLFAIDGYKHIEISEMLGMSANTSKWHLADARKKLQKMLQLKLKASKIVRYEK